MCASGEPRDAEARTRENFREAVSTVTEHMRAEALFASDLQPSDRPTGAQVVRAIHTSLVVRGGAAGCAAIMAAEYGEHPETAALRMRWALALASTTPDTHALAA
ncbi:hypothetical protein GCM10023170_090190 [Phytohabitans houttuyneae]|uniref:Uncharacterized protein n=1 Tax=Phytohabitans houttuyneae TaxID=1076126 RepID=A0A6V8K2N6_9ACTN|nr:hypothetical protein Phou_002270 [Phytohabitans houttuyneae]